MAKNKVYLPIEIGAGGDRRGGIFAGDKAGDWYIGVYTMYVGEVGYTEETG